MCVHATFAMPLPWLDESPNPELCNSIPVGDRPFPSHLVKAVVTTVSRGDLNVRLLSEARNDAMLWPFFRSKEIPG